MPETLFGSMEFRLPEKTATTVDSATQNFLSRSINLHRNRCSTRANINERYRARNSFIMSRQHLHSLLPISLLSSQSKTISKIWNTKSEVFEIYFKYLSSLDTLYLQSFSISFSPCTIKTANYLKACSTTYSAAPKAGTFKFKIVKFRTEKKRSHIVPNNTVFGLQVQDVFSS